MIKKLRSSQKTIVIISLVFVILCGSVVYAWFAKNERVNQGGMEFKTDRVPNLMISDSAATLLNMTTDSGNPFEASFALVTNNPFLPCTRREGALYYVRNTDAIDKHTGKEINGQSFNYGIATAEDGYYKDFEVYLAASEAPISGMKLLLSMIQTGKSETDNHSYLAASVDVYLNSVSNENYKGTLNLAGKDIATGVEKTELEVALPDQTIPKNTSGNIKFVLRYYFDGALMETENTAYINSDTVSSGKIKAGVTFHLVEA